MALPPVAALSSSAKAAASKEGFEGVRVKQERDDEAEIREMAAKMVEQQKAKLANAVPAPMAAPSQRQAGLVAPGQPGIMGFFKGKETGSPDDETKAAEKPALDEFSQRGKFGWVTLGNTHLPCILRHPEEKYCAVRMVESKLLSKYLNYLHADIYSCTCIHSFYITEAEARLLNEINNKHCEMQFGRETFTTKDLVVKLKDAHEFYTFLDVCYSKLLHNGIDGKEKCGFIRINNESVVPYTVKNNNKFVPLFYFEGETDNLKLKAEKLEDWDLAYLKFCCKVQGIRNELFASETCSVISLSDIKSYFPGGTVFEDYWPSKVLDSQLLFQKGSVATGNAASWIKAPPALAVQPAPTTVTVNKVVPSPTPPNTRTAAMPPLPSQAPQQQQPMHNGWPGLVNGQAAYQPTAISSQAQARMTHTNMAAMQHMNQQAAAAASTRSYQPRQMSNTPQYYSSPHSMGLGAQPQVPQPPPLVRVTGPPPTMGYVCKVYTNPQKSQSRPIIPARPRNATYSTSNMNVLPTASSMHQMGMLDSRTGSMLPPPPHLQYPSHNTSAANQQSAQQAKYPPPLIPVNGSNQRYHHYTPGQEVIDLSSPPQSPQRLMGNGKQAVAGQLPDPNGMWKKLIPIMEAPPSSGSHCPYKMQKAYLSEKMVPCINAKPYIYSELLMTIPDMVNYFFPSVSLNECRKVLQDVLRINLYKGNTQQMQVLKENGKCDSMADTLPLIQLRDVVSYMPQMKYIMERTAGAGGGGESAAKRQRTS
ncbi:uncharacterized protein LOC124366001 isoform X1 [Homalodisca vitripennis]|nr:uncharacterized protein LOC124366001 isoform X1 [Homalodisca vitripennis]